MRPTSELILRTGELDPETADRYEALLSVWAMRTGGKLSRIEREQHEDHSMHKSRRRVV